VIEAGLFALLSTTGAITSLGATIYPVVRPPSPVYPCISYKLIAAKPSPTLQTSGYQRWRIEFNCFATTYAQGVALRAALRSTLEGFRGTLNDGTYLQDAQFIQLSDDYEDEPRIYCCMDEFYLFFNFGS
jgi:Protein of unknown function (DUF3168)